MKTIASFLVAFVLAFGAPGALAHEAAPDALAQPASEADEPSPGERVTSQRADQAIYKGVVGNLLEAVPMDPEQRVDLQRANAIVGSPFSVRSLALLVGITNPVVMLGGLLWGFWAASQIEGPKPAAKARPVGPRDEIAAAVVVD